MEPSPFASILHPEAIRRMTDDRSFTRGQDYFARGLVVSLKRREAALSAVVRGSCEYGVRIWVKDRSIAYSCTCPIGADGFFCKHCVAVGLAWLAREPAPGFVAAVTATPPVTVACEPAWAQKASVTATPVVTGPRIAVDDPVEAYLGRLQKPALLALLLDAAKLDPALRARLLAMAAREPSR